ncbi:glycoside hydrolase family 72 protein [Lentithecium fluviatile CBS 122367]|uniref:1,3-beta-glucanosyltransferase n=1 Tax=Lentithecium fluviatile CBS 122367 TaxID=1168545 RepID=A0A6G1J4G3_9PLEO|nr:glycoside hydrolase family 72 protein [Lentithecium fluviatile CBS 122367]
MKSLAVVSLLGASIVPAFAGIVPRQSSGALEPVTVKGNAFYRGNERFYIRGVAYQPGGAADAKDPLLDLETLKTDVENFKDLGVNTIRIYTIDNSKNHDEGMQMLADAGIYLALDANTPDYSLNRETLQTCHRSYNDVYLQSVFATIDAFANYTNTLAFFSGNEVINEPSNTNTAPYIKAVTRDMKQYISNRHSRVIPVGYSAADVASSIEQQALYFDCGSDDARADFFAFNDYSWCDSADELQTFKGAGWDKKVEMFKDFAKPIFLSEHGCIEDVRRWGEVAALYSTQMSAVYSGGLAYEYTVEPNGFGIVDIKNGQVEINEDFTKLKDMYAKTKNPTGSGGAKTEGEASQCPEQSDDWEVEGTALPAIPEKAKKYMTSGAGIGPGLSGDGSHFAGEASKSTATPGSGNPTRTPDGQAAASTGSPEGAAPAVDVPLRFVGMLGASIVFGAALLF